jgi:hypothetical protein
MDVSSSAVTGALRVGLQVISAHKRPVLEIYYQVRNIKGPEYEYQLDNADSTKKITHKSRRQEIFVQFLIANIGGERAENIKLSIDGTFKRERPMGEVFNSIIPQMAPGQTHFLIKIDENDLFEYTESGSRSDFKKDSLTITMEYDAPHGLVNWILSLYSRLRSKRRFVEKFIFSPSTISGDLPPLEYVQ